MASSDDDEKLISTKTNRCSMRHTNQPGHTFHRMRRLGGASISKTSCYKLNQRSTVQWKSRSHGTHHHPRDKDGMAHRIASHRISLMPPACEPIDRPQSAWASESTRALRTAIGRGNVIGHLMLRLLRSSPQTGLSSRIRLRTLNSSRQRRWSN
ncbi:hypothetical protein HYQ46_005110 [Verticillium longisporum]|nr:hypothetical protein HYQ46_005110 [Verticillium longisporum]